MALRERMLETNMGLKPTRGGTAMLFGRLEVHLGDRLPSLTTIQARIVAHIGISVWGKRLDSADR